MATMRVATWNVNSITARLARLHEWLDQVRPDVLCLQETKCPEEAFPADGVIERGYQVAAWGEGRWNGVAILSRAGIAQVSRGFAGQPGWAGEPDAAGPALLDVPPRREARAIAATCGPLRVWSVYVPNGRTPGSPHYAYKLEWLAALRDALAAEVDAGAPLLVAGDFNVAPTDADVWDPEVFAGATHVTTAERQALAELGALGLADIPARALKYDTPFTYWDYRAGMFHKNQGMRIDLVYADRAAAALVRDAYVDREARKGRSPSDHAPVVVDLQLPSGVDHAAGRADR
jgi:exodeoxyribonuclease III